MSRVRESFAERARAALASFVFSGASAQRLGATRLFLGALLIPFFWMQFASFFDAVAPFGPRFYLIDPIWYFRVLGISRFEPLLAQAGVALLTLALAAFALGFRTRASVGLALVLIVFLKGMRDSVAGDVHHRELIPFHVLLFFACSRCGDAFSLDAMRAAPRAPRAPIAEWEAAWPIRAAQLYVASFYWWSGIAKLRASGAYWFGPDVSAQLMLERAVRFGMNGSTPHDGSTLGLWFGQQPELLWLAGAGVAVMELGFPVLLLLRPLWLRLVFVAGVAFFHLANYVLLNVQFLFMPVVFVLFFDVASGVARLAPRLSRTLQLSPGAS
jgi:hypothetical protein